MTDKDHGLFPRATESDRKGGWDISTELLGQLSMTTEEMNPDSMVDMEGVELVLLSLEQLGWKSLPPNAKSEGAEGGLIAGGSLSTAGLAGEPGNGERP